MSYADSSQVKIRKSLLYLKATRAPFLAATTLPMVLGGVIALKEKEGSLFLFILTIACGALINLAANTMNDYFDYIRGYDHKETPRTPFSGGSGLIVAGLLTTNDMLRLSVALIFLVLSAGLAILILSPADTFIILLLGLGGIFLGYAYSAPPFSLSSRGLGELTVFLACGPLSVIAPYYIISGHLSAMPLLTSLPPGLMMTAILWINQFPDFETDRKAGKKNLLVRIGREKGRLLYVLPALTAALSLVITVLSRRLPAECLWGLLFLIPFSAAAVRLFKSYKNPRKLVPAMALTIVSHIIFTGTLILTIVISSPHFN